MPPKRTRVTSQTPSPQNCLDFRATADDAWYAVLLRMEAEGVLRVMFCNFSESEDEKFRAERFRDLEEVEEFQERFRPTSVQLQDSQCGRVIEGMEVCASRSFGENDLRFYDAVIESVCYSKHTLVKGEDVCSCTFVVLWQHGPLAGEKSSAGIENICLVQPRSSKVDPVLDKFLDISRNFFDSSRCEDEPSESRVSTCSPGTHASRVDSQSKPRDYPSNLEEKAPKWIDGLKHTFIGRSCSHRKVGEDVDLGGKLSSDNYIDLSNSNYFIRIENLEKDLSPLNVVEFIHQQTSISSQAFVCPSLLSEPYTRGTIFVDCKENAEKLYDFLHNPAYVIMSSGGRPWMASDKKRMYGTIEGLMPKYEKQPWIKNEEHSNKIKLVHRGTKEYEKGKQLRELFMEFHEHLQRLHNRLALEERKLIYSSHST